MKGLCVLTLVCVALPAASSFAQTGGASDAGGSGGSADRRGQSVHLTSTLVEAYDDNLFADVGSVNPAALIVSGTYTMLQNDFQYSWKNRQSQFGASAAAITRYYTDAGKVKSLSQNLATGFTTRFGQRTSLSVNQTAAHSPSDLLGLFPRVMVSEPGSLAPLDPDYSMSDYEFYSYGTSAGVGIGLTRRSSVSVGADYGYYDFVDETDSRRDTTSYGLQGQFTRAIGRRSTTSVQYQYRTGDFGYGGGAQTVEQGVNVGVEYVRPLSATRQASVGVRLGSSALDVPPGVLNQGFVGRQYRFSGNVNVGYRFGRTWRANANFNRGVEFVAQLGEPVFSNAVMLVADGRLSRRVDVLITGGYATGSSAVNRDGLVFDTYTGTVRLRSAISPRLALYGEYLFYYYDFSGNTIFPTGTPLGLQRNGVRLGLTLTLSSAGRTSSAAR
jgi:hypothetical protein